MKLRNLKENEIKKVSKIVGLNYSKKYEKKSIMEMDAMFKNCGLKPQYIVAEEKNKIVGFGGYTQSWMDYHIYEIFWVNVTPEEQGKGIGFKIIEKIINIIKKKGGGMILLTTSKPKFYSHNFKFKTLSKYKDQKHDLMFLKI